MNLLLFSDPHLNKQDLPECSVILDEIASLGIQHKIDLYIDLGDTLDALKPTSEELDLFSNFIKKINKKIIILAADSHESESQSISIINHFGILNEMVEVVKEYKNGTHLYCGHFIVKEAKKNFGATKSKNDLKYKYVFLGHQHQHEIIKPNICQLGSCRWINFDEVEDKQKIIAIIENYKESNEKVHFIGLKSPIPMKQIELQQTTLNKPQNNPKEVLKSKASKDSISLKIAPQAKDKAYSAEETIAYLDSLDPKMKVKIIVHDFDSYKKWLSLSVSKNYDKKFEKFVIENDFTLSEVPINQKKTDKLPLKSAFEKFAEERKLDKDIREIIEKELNEK